MKLTQLKELIKQVVKEEKRQSNDNQPYGSFLATMCKKVFQNHPFSVAAR